jgi:hypothetical protein
MEYLPKKILLFFALLHLASSVHGSDAPPNVEGLTLEEVVAALGEEPVGMVEAPRATIAYFRLGEVWLREGVVERTNLITPAQLAQREALAKVHRTEALERVERLRLQRIEEGEALRKQRLSSASFLSLDGADQVRSWRQFQASYPEIDISPELQSALALHQSEETERRRQAEMDDLRNRLAIAEAAASRAAREADFARQEAARANAARSVHWWDSTYHRRPIVVIPQSRNPIRIIHHNSSTPPDCPSTTENQRPSFPQVNTSTPHIQSSL